MARLAHYPHPDGGRTIGDRFKTLCNRWVGPTAFYFPGDYSQRTPLCPRCAAERLLRETATQPTKEA